MSELKVLITQRDEILAKISAIEATCEGGVNENNAARIRTLKMERSQLTTQKTKFETSLREIEVKVSAISSEISTFSKVDISDVLGINNALKVEQSQLAAQKTKLTTNLMDLEAKLSAISSEIVTLSGSGIDRILDAIKNQRWFFFKNKPKVLMDKHTGLLWANLDYFPWRKSEDQDYSFEEAKNIVSSCNLESFANWVLPKFGDFKTMIVDKTFPFKEGDDYLIKNKQYWYCDSDMDGQGGDGIDLSDLSIYYDCEHVIPCNNSLVQNSDYANDVAENNAVYSEQERLQFTLDLFVQNELYPIFTNYAITQLYKNIYFEKPQLIKKLEDVQAQIEKLQTITLLSSEFDYTALLEKYDITAIDKSVIKYYQAIQQWTDELLDKLDYYEQAKENIIRDFNLISLKLSKKYEDNPSLTDAENSLLENRQRYFHKNLSLGMNSIRTKILAVKQQADDLEYRIDEIDNNKFAIKELAVLEREDRAGFELLAENTAKIIRNALLKIEYFESNHQFVMSAIDIWEKWSEDYRVFKTTYKEDLKASCENDGIEADIWTQWYDNWQSIRFAIEEKIQPIIERGLKKKIVTMNNEEINIIINIVVALENYKNSIDKFYLEDRKGIYQKFVFQTGGELQDKFEAESELYKCTFALQTALQEIIFNCKDSEDRVFILKWANNLLDIQIDEILSFVADNDLQKISQEILAEFAKLKKKNYEVYLNDATAYGEEQAIREKQYNSLIFKMRKDLMKQ